MEGDEKITGSTKSGTGTDYIYVPSLWYFDHLDVYVFVMTFAKWLNFAQTYRVWTQSVVLQHTVAQICLAVYGALNTDPANENSKLSKTTVTIYQPTWNNKPKDGKTFNAATRSWNCAVSRLSSFAVTLRQHLLQVCCAGKHTQRGKATGFCLTPE
jgi:hypothetical protein